ncbi:hypothetical protein SISNIDRAFT_452048 [Sistotremastrum niveocremeum HHB9708]|uniref:DUF4139 domain-containing protein n=1 Tax=Sistotremastrum niveocremeum HHB9708 TaxID=1314777 RepID=A0A164WX35_9AGAM|nr:hypothetical protein SISNIDRAFT_452048 [Sistotremastrum niveocremeum HHB9708]
MSKIVYDASEHPVNAVTVFQANRAEINRRIQVDLIAGQNEVEVIHLPSVLDEDSIRVDGIGKDVIFDVIYKPPTPTGKGKDSDALKQLLKKKAALDSRKHILEHEDNILSKLAKSDKRSQKRGVTIVIVVIADENGPAELSLSYVVSSAQWKAQYDLRASISNSQQSDTSISLQYRASIWQATGEDWENVELKLSTASPQIGSTVPSLKSEHVHQEIVYQNFAKSANRTRRNKSFGGPPIPAMSRFLRSSGSAESEEDEDVGFSLPAFMATSQTVATENAISANFAIEGLSTIPSNTDDVSQTHQVTIAIIDLNDVSLEWITVPKELPSAFLQVRSVIHCPSCGISLTSDLVSCQEYIPQVSSQESFSCSLGVDPEVRLTYHPVRKMIRTVGGLLSSKTTTTSFTQNITLKNNRRAALKRLIVKDSVPITSDSRFKVNVLLPKGLEGGGPSKASSIARGPTQDVSLGTNVSVRWAPTAGNDNGSREDGVADNVEGTIEWTCVVEPGSSQDLQLVWEVVAPAGVKWTKS